MISNTKHPVENASIISSTYTSIIFSGSFDPKGGGIE